MSTPEHIEALAETWHDAYQRSAGLKPSPWSAMPERNRADVRAALRAVLAEVLPTGAAPAGSSLREDIEHAINRHSRENASGTPDFVLAEYLLSQLASVEATIKARDVWWGFVPRIGGTVPATDLSPAPPINSDRYDND